jgi:hypothetical protein
MDPLEFYKMLKPLEKYKYDIDTILDICYPCKGKWKWANIRNATDEIQELFRQVHMSQEPIIIGKGGHFLPEWNLDVEYNDPLYKKLYVFIHGEDELSEETEISTVVTSSEDIVLQDEKEPEPIFVRDGNWRDENPLFNPRLLDDIKSGYLEKTPFTDKIIAIISQMQTIQDGEYICSDGSGEKITGEAESCDISLGLYSKKNSLLCAKVSSWIRSVQKDYTLLYNVEEYLKKIQKRKCIYKFIQVGDGFYRDYAYRLVGDRDMITKTIQCCQIQDIKPLPLSDAEYKDYGLDLDLLWTSTDILDLDTGQLVKECDWHDVYGWTSVKYRNKVEKIRKYIMTCLMKKYSYKWIPGKTTKWCEKLFGLMKKTRYVDFDNLDNVIKYSLNTKKLYHFSDAGFALRKDEQRWKVRDIEFAYERWKNS